jgi:hypothetical protein
MSMAHEILFRASAPMTRIRIEIHMHGFMHQRAQQIQHPAAFKTTLPRQRTQHLDREARHGVFLRVCFRALCDFAGPAEMKHAAVAAEEEDIDTAQDVAHLLFGDE